MLCLYASHPWPPPLHSSALTQTHTHGLLCARVQAELKRGGLDSDEEEEEAAGVNEGDLFGSDGDDDGEFDPDAADAGGSGGGTGAGGRPAVGRRLRRGAAAAGGGGAGGGDEQMGETDAGQAAAVPLEDDLVFAPMEIEDGDMQDEVGGVVVVQWRGGAWCWSGGVRGWVRWEVGVGFWGGVCVCVCVLRGAAAVERRGCCLLRGWWVDRLTQVTV